MKVYLDNAATTKVDPEVVKVINNYLNGDYGNASSLHKFGAIAKESLENSREVIAKKINALPEEIIFTSSGSESNNTVLKGLKGHIITTKTDHPSVLEVCKNFKDVTYLDVDKYGYVDLEKLEKSIRKDTVLVSVIHGNNEIGTINDLEKIGKICKKYNTLFHSDCIQSFTKVEIDVKKFNLDFASFSGHKIHASKGVAALYVKRGSKLNKLIYGGHQEFDLRAGTENIPGIVGMAKSVELQKPEHIKKMTMLRDKLIKGLLEIPNTHLNGPVKRLCNNVNISFKAVEGESLLFYLDSKGVAVSTGSACTSQSIQPSHVLKAINLSEDYLKGAMRFILSRFTTEIEIDYVIKEVKKAVERLRK